MRTKRTARNFILCTSLIPIFTLCVMGCRQKAGLEVQSTPIELTLACQASLSSGLIAVADEKDFFKQAGVEVKMNLHPSGIESLKAVMRGEAQFATVADIAFAAKMDEDPSLRIIASIGLTAGNQIVARKDRNIHEPADLKGKKIGYSPNTTSDYFLHSYLLTNHIQLNDITAVAIPPARQPEAILTGEIDAVSAFDRYAFAAKKGLGENAITWDSQNHLDYQWLLVTRESSARSMEAMKRMLKALVKAEDFVLSNKDETKSIIARKWDLSPEYIQNSWNQTRLSVSFNQSIITSIKNYAKWKMDKERKTGNPPNVKSYLYTGALEEIDPRLVTIFR